MRPISRLTALFLLVGMAAFWLGVPGLAQHSLGSSLNNLSSDNLSLGDPSLDNPGTDRAGCHHEDSKTPPSTPVSYRCCIAGHDRAIPSSSFSGVAPLPRVAQVSETNPAPPGYAHSIPGIMVASSPSPPGLTPLRI
jgi:hypothetical protein